MAEMSDIYCRSQCGGPEVAFCGQLSTRQDLINWEYSCKTPLQVGDDQGGEQI